LGKQLKNIRENQISNKPNLEELFALSQKVVSNYDDNSQKSLSNTEEPKNDIHYNFDKILNKALNPYSIISGIFFCFFCNKRIQILSKNEEKQTQIKSRKYSLVLLSLTLSVSWKNQHH
jgi:hypothetical protein